jgi:hypothetical protein
VSIPANIVLSTDDITKSRLTFYPNPVKSTLTLKNINSNYNYRIYDISGKLLKQDLKYSSKTINIDYLNKGIYFIEIETDNIKATAKIIKI